MRTYFRYILIALLLCAVSCTTNDEIADPNGDAKISLRLVSSAMTRASDEQHNEDLLDKVDLYLFGNTANASLWHTTLGTNANGSITLNQENESEIYIPASALNSVGDSPKLYVIANYDNTSSPLPESATLDALKKQVVAKASWGPTAVNQAWEAQSSFVMEGLGDVTKNGNQLSGTVILSRAAAKIDLSITDIVDQVVSGDYVWKPVVSDAHALNVTLKNAVTTSYVGADWDKTYEYFGTNGSTVNYTFTAETSSTVDGATITPYSQTNPFYSYSSDQAKGANEAYMVLVVPWQKYDKQNNAVGDVENLYYEVPIGVRDNKRIERNYHYKVSIYVGTLGSTSKDESVTLEPEITVVDWSTGQIAVDIKEARYLVVEEKKIEIFNQTSGGVNFSTSHPVTVEIISVEKPNFLGKVASKYTYYPSGNNKQIVTPTVDSKNKGNTNPFTIVASNGIIELSHTLVNDRDSNAFDFGIYTVKAKIYHTDAPTTFYEEITFLQYPAMYVEAYLNTDYVNYNETDNDYKDDNNVHKGYVWVNNSQTGGQSAALGGVNGLGSATNANPNMYVISTSVLPSGSTYMLADPRAAVYNNNLGENSNNWSSSAAALYPTGSPNRRLTYYYPNGANVSTTEQIIAPKFRVASSYGVVYASTYDEMARRCASYQEDGYPAGRWRMPTAAEVKYIVSLSVKGIIPLLFNNGDEYACAEGYIVANANTGVVDFTADTDPDATLAVRCVYDDWYWGSERVTSANSNTLTQFTWGDMPR